MVYRPTTEYDEEQHPPLVYRLGLLGVTNDEMAEVIGISPRIFTDWLERYPALSAALTDAGEKADAEIAEALHRRARGYDRPVTKIVCNEQTGETTITEYIEHIPPDVRAVQYWLNNRERGRIRRREKLTGKKYESNWTSRETVEVTGEDGKPIEMNVTSARERIAGRIASIATRVREGDSPGGAE